MDLNRETMKKLMFLIAFTVLLLVGIQGVAEFLVSGLLGGIVARAVERYLK